MLDITLSAKGKDVVFMITNMAQDSLTTIQVTLFLSLCFKMKKIEIQMNPKYTDFEEIKANLIKYMCFSNILIALFIVAYATTLWLYADNTIMILYKSVRESDSHDDFRMIMSYIQVYFFIVFYIYLCILCIYFYKMGVSYVTIL